MAPIRKSRSVNVISLSKDAEKFNKSLQWKRKLSDILGSRWSKEELKHFYEAYCKYGKDWKKVAAAVPDRSVDMVEALYMMNRTYLSLPAGAASAVGLIAMMTDHYCNLVESNRDPESSKGGDTSLNSRKKLKSYPEISASKKKSSGGTQPQINGKRTPRFPVSFSDKSVGGGKFCPSMISRLSNRRSGKVILLPSWNEERVGTELESTSARHLSDMDEDGLERGKNINVQTSETNYVVKNNLDGIKEASSVSGKLNSGVKPGKIARHIAKKNSKKAQDEGSALEALQTLADLSLMIPATAAGNGTTVHFEEKESNQIGASTGKTSNPREGSGLDNNGIPIAKTPREEFHTVTHQNDSQEAEASYVRKLTRKGGDASFNISPQNQGRKWITYSKRKEDLQKPQNLKDVNKNDMLINCLLSKQLRRWCVFEWFYSAIDYPWFARREFVEYLNHVGLGHVPRLNRIEWGVIRSSLGKPRRFSEQFLKEEKENLSRYRDSVRKYYNEFHEGVMERLPIDIPRPLSVGQRVMAIHPTRREISDGNVSTVDYNRFKVQFDRPELGVEFVQDIDCMPLNPLENMPVSIARKAAARNELFTSFYEITTSGRAKNQKAEGAETKSSGEILELGDVASHLSPACNFSNLMKEVKEITNDFHLQDKAGIDENCKGQQVVYSALLAQIQAKEDEKQALSELTRILKKKETLVFELQSINDVVKNRSDGDSALGDSKYMKKQYASVLVQLDSVNGQAIHVQKLGFLIHELVESQELKLKLWQTQISRSLHQAMPSLKIEENTLKRIKEAMYYTSNRISRWLLPPTSHSSHVSD